MAPSRTPGEQPIENSLDAIDAEHRQGSGGSLVLLSDFLSEGV
jgi:hypothetical protein